jgi:hypothetical protein
MAVAVSPVWENFAAQAGDGTHPFVVKVGRAAAASDIERRKSEKEKWVFARLSRVDFY